MSKEIEILKDADFGVGLWPRLADGTDRRRRLTHQEDVAKLYERNERCERNNGVGGVDERVGSVSVLRTPGYLLDLPPTPQPLRADVSGVTAKSACWRTPRDPLCMKGVSGIEAVDGVLQKCRRYAALGIETHKRGLAPVPI